MVVSAVFLGWWHICLLMYFQDSPSEQPYFQGWQSVVWFVSRIAFVSLLVSRYFAKRRSKFVEHPGHWIFVINGFAEIATALIILFTCYQAFTEGTTSSEASYDFLGRIFQLHDALIGIVWISVAGAWLFVLLRNSPKFELRWRAYFGVTCVASIVMAIKYLVGAQKDFDLSGIINCNIAIPFACLEIILVSIAVFSDVRSKTTRDWSHYLVVGVLLSILIARIASFSAKDFYSGNVLLLF